MDINKSIKLLNNLTSLLDMLTNDKVEGLFRVEIIEEFVEEINVTVVLEQHQATEYLTQTDTTNETVMFVLDRYDTAAIITVFEKYLISLNGINKKVRLFKINVEVPFPNPIFEWNTELDTQAVIRLIKNKIKKGEEK